MNKKSLSFHGDDPGGSEPIRRLPNNWFGNSNNFMEINRPDINADESHTSAHLDFPSIPSTMDQPSVVDSSFILFARDARSDVIISLPNYDFNWDSRYVPDFADLTCLLKAECFQRCASALINNQIIGSIDLTNCTLGSISGQALHQNPKYCKVMSSPSVNDWDRFWYQSKDPALYRIGLAGLLISRRETAVSNNPATVRLGGIGFYSSSGE